MIAALLFLSMVLIALGVLLLLYGINSTEKTKQAAIVFGAILMAVGIFAGICFFGEFEKHRSSRVEITINDDNEYE